MSNWIKAFKKAVRQTISLSLVLGTIGAIIGYLFFLCGWKTGIPVFFILTFICFLLNEKEALDDEDFMNETISDMEKTLDELDEIIANKEITPETIQSLPSSDRGELPQVNPSLVIKTSEVDVKKFLQESSPIQKDQDTYDDRGGTGWL